MSTAHSATPVGSVAASSCGVARHGGRWRTRACWWRPHLGAGYYHRSPAGRQAGAGAGADLHPVGVGRHWQVLRDDRRRRRRQFPQPPEAQTLRKPGGRAEAEGALAPGGAAVGRRDDPALAAGLLRVPLDVDRQVAAQRSELRLCVPQPLQKESVAPDAAIRVACQHKASHHQRQAQLPRRLR